MKIVNTPQVESNFTKIPNSLFGSELQPVDRMVLIVIMHFRVGTDISWEQVETLANVSKNTLRRCKQRLKDLGYIQTNLVNGEWQLLRSWECPSDEAQNGPAVGAQNGPAVGAQNGPAVGAQNGPAVGPKMGGSYNKDNKTIKTVVRLAATAATETENEETQNVETSSTTLTPCSPPSPAKGGLGDLSAWSDFDGWVLDRLVSYGHARERVAACSWVHMFVSVMTRFEAEGYVERTLRNAAASGWDTTRVVRTLGSPKALANFRPSAVEPPRAIGANDQVTRPTAEKPDSRLRPLPEVLAADPRWVARMLEFSQLMQGKEYIEVMAFISSWSAVIDRGLAQLEAA